MSGVRIGVLVRHLVTGVEVLRLNGHCMRGMRVGLQLRSGMARVRIGLLLRRWMPGVAAMLLASGRNRGNTAQQGKKRPHHAASPSRGRTVTTRIMPACM